MSATVLWRYACLDIHDVFFSGESSSNVKGSCGNFSMCVNNYAISSCVMYLYTVQTSTLTVARLTEGAYTDDAIYLCAGCLLCGVNCQCCCLLHDGRRIIVVIDESLCILLLPVAVNCATALIV